MRLGNAFQTQIRIGGGVADDNVAHLAHAAPGIGGATGQAGRNVGKERHRQEQLFFCIGEPFRRFHRDPASQDR